MTTTTHRGLSLEVHGGVVGILQKRFLAHTCSEARGSERVGLRTRLEPVAALGEGLEGGRRGVHAVVTHVGHCLELELLPLLVDLTPR